MHGTVRGADGIGLPGVIVSNGQDTTRTDDDGTYTLPERGRFVFVSRPEGFTATRWWFPATPGPVDFDLVEQQQSLPFEIVHLTDTHLSVPGGVAEGTERKQRSMYPEGGLSDQFTALLRSLPSTLPDAQAIFLTGDLVDTGVSDEYEALVEVLAASPLPVHAIPGNHDHMNGRSETAISPNNYLTNAADPSAYENHLGPRWYSFDIPGLHVVAMDWHTHELGLDDVVQEEWLRNDLALVSPDTPWALLFHDQPNDTLLTNVPRPPVATFSGHWHTSRVVRVGGTLHVNTAPTFFAGLDYSPPSLRRAVWDGTEFTLDTVALHLWDDARLAPVLSKSTIASAPNASTVEAVRWRTFLTGAGHRQGVSISEGQVFIGSQIEDSPGGAVEALELDTGRVLWTAHTASSVKVAPTVVGDVVVGVEVTGDVSGYDRTDGTLLWTCPSPDPLRRFAWGAASEADGSVVVGDQADLRRIDVNDGRVLWRRTDLAPHHNLVSHTAPLIVDDLVVAGFWPSPEHPIGLSLATGDNLWTQAAAESSADFRKTKRLLVMGTATYDASTETVLLPGYSATVAVDAASGTLTWVAEHAGNYSATSPVVTDRGILVTVVGRGLTMLDRTDGHILWDLEIDSAAPFPMQPYSKQAGSVLAPPLVLDDTIILPCLDGTIRTYSLDGVPLTTVSVGVPTAAPLVDAGHLLIGVGLDGGVYAMDREALL
ncbi:PQQ-binding-like beta-propeller repeat protein [Rhodococcus sp. NPDC060090]|uniref:outer membrane protein assembly factor BamB family protein n=1 Tax=Rhodococcus sp. NPDC060090 TaxID=3347056 RepID=UPI003668A7C4